MLGLFNFNAIFEFFGQFTMKCTYNSQKGVDKFEMHKTCYFLARGVVPP